MLSGASLPEHGPVPISRPETAPAPKEAPGRSPDPVQDGESKEESPTILIEEPLRLKACLTDLKAYGVVYRELPAIDDGNGCGIARPIAVTSLGRGVALQPEGAMRCETALWLARWTVNTILPNLAAAKPTEKLAGLEQASAYVCRKRNGAETGKISEHARGNAIDIAALRFKSGGVLLLKPRLQDPTMDGALQRAITASACLYFSTVLSPGSDAAHQDHLHLDVLERRNGYRFCR